MRKNPDIEKLAKGIKDLKNEVDYLTSMECLNSMSPEKAFEKCVEYLEWHTFDDGGLRAAHKFLQNWYENHVAGEPK